MLVEKAKEAKLFGIVIGTLAMGINAFFFRFLHFIDDKVDKVNHFRKRF